MTGTIIESEYEGFYYNPSLLVSELIHTKYGLDIREEYEDSIAQYLEFQILSSPTKNQSVMKDVFVFDGGFVIVRFREKYSNAYI